MYIEVCDYSLQYIQVLVAVVYIVEKIGYCSSIVYRYVYVCEIQFEE